MKRDFLGICFFFFSLFLFFNVVNAQAMTENQALQVAKSYFGPKDCVSISWQDSLATPFYEGQVAEAYLGGCEIHLVRGLFGAPTTRASNGTQVPVSDPVWCQIIVHEYGHNMGLTHDSPVPVMQNPWERYLIPGCYSRSQRITMNKLEDVPDSHRRLRVRLKLRQLRKVV